MNQDEQNFSKASSIRGKIYNFAKKSNIPGSKMYIRYFLERLLYRIMNSKYKNNFIIRGSSLLYIYNSEKARQTKDLDFMGVGIDNSLNYMEKAFKEIISVQCPEDCVEFLPETLKVEKIQSDKLYSSVRVSMVATLQTMREKVSLDIGFDDVITPEAKLFKYPIILKDIPGFDVRSYTIETSLAEKVETIISRGDDNTRMKDYYDIWYILTNIGVDENVFRNALINTFSHRNTEFNDASVVFDIDFYLNTERNKLWIAFMKKSEIPFISLYDVGLFIIENIKPIITSLSKTNILN